MKTLFITLFLLLPFALSVVMPQMIVHAHEIATDDNHAGHHGHHHPGDDAQDTDTQANKDIKMHTHDGQVHEYVKLDHFPSKSYERAGMPPLTLISILASTIIKPPLEPPTYL